MKSKTKEKFPDLLDLMFKNKGATNRSKRKKYFEKNRTQISYKKIKRG